MIIIKLANKFLIAVMCLGFALGTTAQTIQTTFFSETFQAPGTAIPAGWTQTTMASDSGWKVNINTALQSQYFQIPAHTRFACTNDDACDCDKSADRLILPPQNFSTASAVIVRFDYYYLNLTENASLEVSIDSGANWINVGDLQGKTNEWQTRSVNITSLAAGDSNVLISFLYNDTGEFAYGLCVDNVVVFEPIPTDVALTQISPVGNTAYGASGGNIAVGGSVTNYGAAPVNNYVVKWTDGTTTYADTLSTSLFTLDTVQFTHKIPYHIPSTGQHPITMWVELANDPIHDNDTLNTTISGYLFKPTHKVTIEDQTICSDDNGWFSARGVVYMDSFLKSQYAGDAELIAVHAALDPMAVTEYWNGCFYGNSPNVTANAWPQLLVERKVTDNNSQIFNQFQQHKNDFGVADVHVTVEYDTATRALNVTGEAHFSVAVNPALARFNLAMVVTEDSVHHAGDTLYDQRNAFSGGSYGPMAMQGLDFVAQPDPVPSDLMYYRNVARMISVFKGHNGSLPDTIAENSTHSYAFPPYTIPAGYNPEKMRAIVLLIDRVSGEIRNSNGAAVFIDSTTGINDVRAAALKFKIYPNPFSNAATVTFSLTQSQNITLQVTNVVGETVVLTEKSFLAAGQHTLSLNRKNLSPGVYFVTLHAGNDSVTQKVIVE